MPGPTTERGLIDTSVAIVLEKLDRAYLPAELAISAISLAELSTGPLGTMDLAKRASRQDQLQRLEASIESLAFDSSCARAYAPIFAAVSAIGRKPRGRRSVDLLVAATARGYGLPLYTLNAADLRGLDDLVEIVDLSQYG